MKHDWRLFRHCSHPAHQETLGALSLPSLSERPHFGKKGRAITPHRHQCYGELPSRLSNANLPPSPVICYLEKCPNSL